jgi:transcription elongation factor Elf1
MSLFVDRKFVSLVSMRLERFKQKNDYLWNFRCPICNDSKKNKSKARGFLYRKTDNLFYTCHNCGASMSLSSFLKSVDVVLYNQHKLETYMETNASANVAQPDFTELKEKPVFSKQITKENKLPASLLSELPQDHPARQYVLGRKIPKNMFSKLYYTDDFGEFAKTLFPESMSNKSLHKNDKRVIIPIFDKDNNLIAVQGRTISGSPIKYITLKKDDSVAKVYGLDIVDLSKTVYVVEGPIDSMFLPNTIATMDANLTSVYSTVGDHDYVFVFDNEPRNPHIVKFMQKAIAKGRTLCIWPQNIASKDINDMVLEGMTPTDIKCIIDSNTFTGLKAKVQFDLWKKI